jgi:hypothetical protein
MMDAGDLPFAQTRHRGYANKLQSITGAWFCLQTTTVPCQGNMLHVISILLQALLTLLLPVGAGIPLSTSVALALQSKHVSHAAAAPAALQAHTSNNAGAAATSEQPNAAVLQGALDEIASLKSQLSGMEAAVTLISRASSSSPVSSGRHSPAHGRRAAPRQQQSGAASSSSSIKASVHASKQDAAAFPPASGKLWGSKPGSHAATAAAAAGSHVRHEPVASLSSSCAGAAGTMAGHLPLAAAWLISAEAPANSSSEAQSDSSMRVSQKRGATRSCSPGAADGMCEDAMQAVIKVRAYAVAMLYCMVQHISLQERVALRLW